ncbi:MAG: WD40/YVTN/BNR-like repeat-containing protein, partial [Candidatus Halalkalibacterium sp. M3_1C_030]
MRKLLTALFVLFLIQFLQLSAPLESFAQKSSKEVAKVDTSLFSDMEFRTVGPTRGGRVTAVEGHRAHPHKFYMGAAGGGGVWKTEDYGQSWINISDGHGFASTTIGAIQIADSDTSIIYVGTGTDGIRANVTTGRGLYKSTDAGKNWKFMGLEDAGQIGSIEVHPDNPDRVYVAALGHPFGPNPQRGVFRSDDGGENWEKILFASDTTGAIDLELNPENPDEIYAALWRAERKPWTIISGAAKENGLYKSTDGGDTWKKLSKGLPQGLTGKADFAVTPADPDRVYALFEAPEEEEGLYRSDDRGESWTLVSDTSGIMNRPFYFTNVDADPKNPDKVYVGNVRYWVSEDGGKTFERRRVTHADVHDLWINPDNPNIQIQGNDGGATVTLDGGKTWSTQHNQPTAELYQVHVDDRFPYWLYAGQQDNTTIAVPSLPPAESDLATGALWHDIGGCETGPAVPTPNNPNITYANCKGRFGQYNWETGQEKQFWVGAEYMYGRNPADLTYRFQRVVPIEVSPHDSSVVYNTSQYVHRTENGGQTWKRISPDLT